MKKVFAVITIVILVLFALFAVDLTMDVGLRAWFNTKRYAVKKVDDVTNYDTIKKVEDKCRSMISSYESDKMMYETYKDTNKEWSEQARIRANKTAVAYNEYILKNSFVFKDNVPEDIKSELEYI